MRTILPLLLIVATFHQTAGQFLSPASNWYFGNEAGITWCTLQNTGDPMYLMDGVCYTSEGVAAISDSQGNLIMYTEGLLVYNKLHQVMSNTLPLSPGGTLSGDPSSSQSAVIVPKPSDTTTYYVFTVDAQFGIGGLAYSRVDMTANGGLGDVDVSEKNVTLLSLTTEKISAVHHTNGIDYWVITHPWNSSLFACYLVNSIGVNVANPVYSNVGILHSGITANSRGYLKCSPQGDKVALGIEGLEIWQLFDFNNLTGQLSNAIALDYPSNDNCYGVEFSADGNVLYGSERWGQHIHQWNLSFSNPAAIIASHQIVAVASTGFGFGGGLQLGPDQKIYHTRNNSKFLGRINNPSVIGTGCNYVDSALLLGPEEEYAHTSFEGLPNFITSSVIVFQVVADFIATDTAIALGNTIHFIDQSTGFPTSWHWDFGDGNNTTVQDPYHSYQSIGIYAVSLVASNLFGSDTVLFQNYIQVVDSVPPPSNWTYLNTGNSHIINIQNNIPATIDSTQIDLGDYIGVFYDSIGITKCAGYNSWLGQSIDLTAWGDDPLTIEKEGFTTGETFQWKVWRASDNTVFEATASYIQPPAMPNIGSFTTNGLSGLSSLEALTIDHQYINLPQGWSLFSTYIEPFEANMDSIFESIVLEVVICKDGTGSTYWPLYGINMIGDIALGDGYQIKMDTAQTLVVEGLAVVPENTPVVVDIGWSYLAYLRQMSAPIDSMLNPIVSEVIIVKTGNGLTYWPLYGVNMIGNMNPGEGYQIKMNSQQILTYPANN
jgi:PKD repeat protein